jgi:hypothetical protein
MKSRRGGQPVPPSGDEGSTQDDAARGTLSQRLIRLNLVAAVAFTVGGSLFALGAFFAQNDVGTLTTVNITYLVGGFFFSLGGYASVVLAANGATDESPGDRSSPMRWWGYQPRQLGWLSAAVLFVGTLLFAVSLIAAFAQSLTPRQSNGWIWFPDIAGCVCFLVSGHLALLDACGGHIGVRVHSLSWWVVAVNQFGSFLFFLAGVAAFTRPATSRALDIGLVNGGTFAGAVCFAVGGVLQALDEPTPTRTVVRDKP